MTDQPKVFDQNLYEILEVKKNASQQEIYKAYQRARATYCQDSPALYTMFTREEAQELLKLVEEAYAVLSNPALRDVYDRRQDRDNGLSVSELTNSETHRTDRNQAMDDSDVNQKEFTPYKVKPKAETKASSSEGEARTRYSTYKRDEAFEQEIQNCRDFDGPFLQRVRNYKNISLDQMAEITKVGTRYLAAIEANDFSNLPAAVFVRGFIVHLSRVLELNEAKTVSSYMDIFKRYKKN